MVRGWTPGQSLQVQNFVEHPVPLIRDCWCLNCYQLIYIKNWIFFLSALNMGTEMLELDVRLTADKQVQTNSQADLKKILQ